MEATVRDKDTLGERNVREAQVALRMCHFRSLALNPPPTGTEAMLPTAALSQ